MSMFHPSLLTLLEASELKNATKDAMQQTKEAFAAEAKMVAKDMVDLKAGDGRLGRLEGVASGGKTITTWWLIPRLASGL